MTSTLDDARGELLALADPPEVWLDCPACGGSGEILETIHVYEAGCGFSHPDVYSKPCRACNGAGGAICEAEDDR